MNYIDNIITIEEQLPVMKNAPANRFVRSLEYEAIVNLAMKQFLAEDQILFDKLLSIPLTERIPGLINEHGLKKAQRLIKLILQEFCYSVKLPKAKKLNETKITACAFELIVAAYEDQLSLEDLIIFFERAKEGKYGKFKCVLTHLNIMKMLEQYRLTRTSAYLELKEKHEAEMKMMSDQPRIGDVRSIGEIMKVAQVIDITRRMSG